MSSTRNRDATATWLGLAAFAGSMLLVWQGLDFTDMGWLITAYDDFYTRPDTMCSFGVLAACWLTCFIGHWTGVVLGGGVLAYKLGYVVVITASAVISYQLLASQFGPGRLLAALVLLTVFFTRSFAGNWICYNELTALLYLAGAALLFHGLAGNRKTLVVLAGIVLGTNVFVRLPNLGGVALVSAVWLHAVACRRSWRELLIWSAWFLGGFAVGMALILCLIALSGHWSIYFQNIRALLGVAEDASSIHPASELFRRFITNHVMAFGLALPLVVFGGWLAAGSADKGLFCQLPSFRAGSLLLWFALHRLYYWRWVVPGLCYVVLLAVVIREWRKDRGLSLLAFIAGLILLLAPIGSNNGILNSVFGMWLALPLTLMLLWRSSDVTIGRFSMKAGGFHVFTATILLALSLQSLAWALRHTYRDSKNRLLMTHSIDHPLLIGTFTTAARAQVVGELLDAMRHYSKPGDELLAYNSIPLVHYLTRTHPWLGDPWPDIAGVTNVAALVRKNERSWAKLPCIVRAKRSTESINWPVAASQLTSKYGQQDEIRQLFAEFERRHGYVVVWSNDFFEILTPGGWTR